MGFFRWVFYCQPCLALVEHAQVDEGRTVASAPETDERRRCSAIIEKHDVLLKSYGTIRKECSGSGSGSISMRSAPETDERRRCSVITEKKRTGAFFIFFFSLPVRIFNTVLSAAPQLHCVGGRWDRTQDSCVNGTGCQKKNLQ